jgi:hypothetical protein
MAKKVLVIDDDNDFVESVVNLLEASGYTVASASNGKEGVEKAKSRKARSDSAGCDDDHQGRRLQRGPPAAEIEGVKGTPVIMVTGVRKEMNLPFGFEPMTRPGCRSSRSSKNPSSRKAAARDAFDPHPAALHDALRQIGFPTANIDPIEQVIPAEGVYAGYVVVGDRLDEVVFGGLRRPAAISVGRAKTFSSDHPLLLEAHLLETRVENLANKWLGLDFMKYLRHQQRFEDKEHLKAQIARDIERAERMLF